MSKFKCDKCNNNCTVVLERGIPANCVLDADAPCWREEITLSPDVFKLPECPDWANYAAASPDGTIWVYENKPKCTGRYWHQATGRFDDLTSVYTEAGGEILVQKEVKPILLTDKIKPGDWIYNWLSKQYEQVTELKGSTVRTVKYFKGQRSHSDWHVDQINGYFDLPNPIEVKPIPEYDAYKLVGKVIQDAKGNTELIMSWNVDQHKVYMDYHAVTLEELTKWWLDDEPCGIIRDTEEDNEDI